MVPVDSDGISLVPPYSGYPSHQACLPVRGSHPLRPTFPSRSSSHDRLKSRSYNPGLAVTSPVWALPSSLATTNGITIVFSSSAYLDVSVRQVCLPCGMSSLQLPGLPHSDTHGSILMCRSPWLFAAYRVLRRL